MLENVKIIADMMVVKEQENEISIYVAQLMIITCTIRAEICLHS